MNFILQTSALVATLQPKERRRFEHSHISGSAAADPQCASAQRKEEPDASRQAHAACNLKVYTRAARSLHRSAPQDGIQRGKQNSPEPQRFTHSRASHRPSDLPRTAISSLGPLQQTERTATRVTPSSPKPRRFALVNVTPPPHPLPSTPYDLRRALSQKGGTRLLPNVVAPDWHENQNLPLSRCARHKGYVCPTIGHKFGLVPAPQDSESGEHHILRNPF